MKRWIGIDAGGTSFKIGLFDGNLDKLAHFEIQRQQLAVFETLNDADLLIAALRSINLKPSESHTAGIAAGWAGYAKAEDRAHLKQQLRAHFPGIKIGVFSDAQTAHAGAFGNADGLLSIHGTGSLQLFRVNNDWFRLNGFGFMIGDVCGGVSIGRNAAKKALVQLNAGISTALTTEFISFISPLEPIDWILKSKHSPELVAGFAEHVLNLSALGEPEAVQIVQNELSDFKHLLQNVNGEGRIPVVLHGGLTANITFYNQLAEVFRNRGFIPIHKTIDAARGAIELLKSDF